RGFECDVKVHAHGRVPGMKLEMPVTKLELRISVARAWLAQRMCRPQSAHRSSPACGPREDPRIAIVQPQRQACGAGNVGTVLGNKESCISASRNLTEGVFAGHGQRGYIASPR